MSATIVHLAVAGLLAAALLGEAYGPTALAVVFAATAVPDLDSFVAWYTAAGHRVALHNVWIPVLGGVLLWIDLRLRERSVVRQRWGGWGVRVLWVSLLCYLCAGILIDLADGYVNLFWPVYDQFYVLDGRLELSDQRGIVQTFSDGGLPLLDARGSIAEVRLTTGVDPGPSTGGDDPERLFPVFRAGWQLVLFLIGTAVTLLRFRLPYETNAG